MNNPEDFWRDIPNGVNKVIVYVNYPSGHGEVLEVLTEVGKDYIFADLFRTNEPFETSKYKSVKILMVDENFTL
jgi:hypothetical protein